MALRFVFFLLSLATAFVLIYEKLFLDDIDPHRKIKIYILKSFFIIIIIHLF